MKIVDTLKLALRALVASSPHADAMNGWKDAEWQQLRGEAIAVTSLHIERMKPSGTVQICLATAEHAVSESDTPGATAHCTDTELMAWLAANHGVELTSLATSASNRADEPFSVVEITQTGPGGDISRIELLATGTTRRGALCAAVNRARTLVEAMGERNADH